MMAGDYDHTMSFCTIDYYYIILTAFDELLVGPWSLLPMCADQWLTHYYMTTDEYPQELIPRTCRQWMQSVLY